jgi:hypothetical protein
MQRGSLAVVSRKEAPGVWQFRWSEKDLHGVRVQRKRVIGSVERCPNEAAARSAVKVLLAEINSEKVRMGSRSITMAQLWTASIDGSHGSGLKRQPSRPGRMIGKLQLTLCPLMTSGCLRDTHRDTHLPC